MVLQRRIIHEGSSPCCSPLKTAIEECDLASGTLSEQRLQQIFDGFSADICEQLLKIGQGAGDAEADEA